MNLASEIEFYSELRLLDKARLLNLFMHELAQEARGTYGAGAEQVTDGAHMRFITEQIRRLRRSCARLWFGPRSSPFTRAGWCSSGAHGSLRWVLRARRARTRARG